MAGDWIKMRMSLHSHPKVVRIASAFDADKCPDRLRVVGGLHAVWSLFDMHSEDGRLDGYSAKTIDDMIGWPGFAAAMELVEWLEVSEDSVYLPRFDAHNGKSAKRRAMESERKRRSRAEEGGQPEVVEMSAFDADRKRTREEKRREEEERESPVQIDPPVDQSIDPPAESIDTFAEFWAVYPKREAKQAAVKAWKQLKPDAELVATIVAAVKARSQTPQWLEAGGKYVPLPATYLNGERWLDNAEPKGASRPSWWLADGFGSEADAVRARNQVAAA